MFQVLLALVPAGIAHVALFGPGLLLQIAVAAITALVCEALALRWRRREAGPALRDGSVLVTAVLLAFSITPLLPFWLTILGTASAVLLGKHLFGGLGQNPFNPAMVGYAVLLVSFPVAMTQWPVPLDAAAHDWSDLARMTFAAFIGADECQPGMGRLHGRNRARFNPQWPDVALHLAGDHRPGGHRRAARRRAASPGSMAWRCWVACTCCNGG